ncbi:unnamed protein product [Protopolystoma xenopodis]|uniref:Uncharacterized protein n=1 Tax=Protopolystoma xenopodis TaxID=117903 RepID=A0A3S5B1L2_9PLAT|nr:unnamed protein product [Protopolystoma xenopodis]
MSVLVCAHVRLCEVLPRRLRSHLFPSLSANRRDGSRGGADQITRPASDWVSLIAHFLRLHFTLNHHPPSQQASQPSAFNSAPPRFSVGGTSRLTTPSVHWPKSLFALVRSSTQWATCSVHTPTLLPSRPQRLAHRTHGIEGEKEVCFLGSHDLTASPHVWDPLHRRKTQNAKRKTVITSILPVQPSQSVYLAGEFGLFTFSHVNYIWQYSSFAPLPVTQPDLGQIKLAYLSSLVSFSLIYRPIYPHVYLYYLHLSLPLSFSSLVRQAVSPLISSSTLALSFLQPILPSLCVFLALHAALYSVQLTCLGIHTITRHLVGLNSPITQGFSIPLPLLMTISIGIFTADSLLLILIGRRTVRAASSTTGWGAFIPEQAEADCLIFELYTDRNSRHNRTHLLAYSRNLTLLRLMARRSGRIDLFGAVVLRYHFRQVVFRPETASRLRGRLAPARATCGSVGPHGRRVGGERYGGRLVGPGRWEGRANSGKESAAGHSAPMADALDARLCILVKSFNASSHSSSALKPKRATFIRCRVDF